MDFVQDLIHILNSGYDATNILFCLALIDTALGIAWRIKKKRRLVSRRLIGGLWQNLSTAFIPYLLQLFADIRHEPHAVIYMTVIYIAFGFVMLALMQSIITNAYLCGFIIPKKFDPFIEKYFGAEIFDKLDRDHVNRK